MLWYVANQKLTRLGGSITMTIALARLIIVMIVFWFGGQLMMMAMGLTMLVG